jgi:hypothetical protein
LGISFWENNHELVHALCNHEPFFALCNHELLPCTMQPWALLAISLFLHIKNVVTVSWKYVVFWQVICEGSKEQPTSNSNLGLPSENATSSFACTMSATVSSLPALCLQPWALLTLMSLTHTEEWSQGIGSMSLWRCMTEQLQPHPILIWSIRNGVKRGVHILNWTICKTGPINSFGNCWTFSFALRSETMASS